MGFKKLLVIGAGLACALAWIGLAAGLVVGVGTPLRVVLVTAAAVTTEVLFWAVALLLGLKVVEARRKIWAWLTHPFRAHG